MHFNVKVVQLVADERPPVMHDLLAKGNEAVEGGGEVLFVLKVGREDLPVVAAADDLLEVAEIRIKKQLVVGAATFLAAVPAADKRRLGAALLEPARSARGQAPLD